MQQITWDDLRIVLAVADAGSVNAAATNLGVNHATILRRVSRFEAAHGIAIFIRSARGYSVAPGSRAILDAIRDVERSIEAVDRTLAGSGTPLSGTIQITSTDTLCQSILPPLIRTAGKQHPDLTIQMITTNARLNLAKLDAEITVRPARELPDNLTGRIVNKMNFKVYGSLDYLRENNSSELHKHRWLGVTELLKRSPVGQWQQRLHEENIVFRADSFVTICEMVEAGMGLSMLPKCLGNRSPVLTNVPGIDDGLWTNLWVATHADLASSPKISACIDYFANAISDIDSDLI